LADSKQESKTPKANVAFKDQVSNLLQNQSTLLVITLVVLGAFFQWGSEGIFLDLGTLGTVLQDWGSYILLAVAETLVVITGGIDLSVGSIVSLSSVAGGYVLVNVMHADPALSGDAANGYVLIATITAVAVGAFVGLINALLINYLKIVPFIATLATMGAAAGVAVILAGGFPIQGPNNYGLGTNIKIGDGQLPFSIAVLIVGVVTVIVGLFLHKSRFGLYTYALGSNAFATRGAGISVTGQITKVYILSGALSGLAGAYAYVRLGSGSPSNGMGMELYAIAATVIGGASLMGGVGRIVGVALGTLVLFTVQSGLLMMKVVTVDPQLKQVIVAILIAAAVAVQTLRKSNRK